MWAALCCQDQISNNTGLYKHFMEGCPAHVDGDLSNLSWTILDSLNTSAERLDVAGHLGGARCRCSECTRLKMVEDKWICRLGSFYGASGLNTRDEIKARSRVNFRGN